MNELVIIERSDIVAVADSVRNKIGVNKELTLGEMIGCINSIGSDGSGIDTSDATITSGNQMLSGVTAYGANGKITGSFTIDNEITAQDNIISQIQAALEGKAANTGIDTSDATATSEDIVSGKTAYVNGEKIVGTYQLTKTTKTIYLDWSGDEEMICVVEYVSNGELIQIYSHDSTEIEADGGIVHYYGGNEDCYHSDNFIEFYKDSWDTIVIATQDNETVYLCSSGMQ